MPFTPIELRADLSVSSFSGLQIIDSFVSLGVPSDGAVDLVSTETGTACATGTTPAVFTPAFAP